MPGRRTLLAPHETVVFDIRPHWVALVPPILWTILIGAALIAVRWLLERVDGIRFAWITWVVGLAAWVILAVVPAIRWHFTRTVLTTDRLMTSEGLIARRSKEILLERINDVALTQTFLERIFGVGDLLVESAGERGQEPIRNVADPEKVRLQIYEQTEANNNRMLRPAAEAVVAREPTIPDQIEALARLRDSGAISEAEYDAKKQELLKRL